MSLYKTSEFPPVLIFKDVPTNCFCTSLPCKQIHMPRHPSSTCAKYCHWMSCNKIKLNRDKTELLVISSKYRPRPSLDSILVGDHRVKRSNKARNIGVVFYETLSLDKHVSSVCKSALFHLRNIAKIRMYLTSESTDPRSCLCHLSTGQL